MGGNQSQPNATAIIGTGKGGPLDTSAGTIASRGISFTYDHAAEPALRDITLTVPAGECIVLCGASGCGKTSYTRVANGLIPSFFHGAFAGNQTTCGLDVETVPIDRLTPLVGSVFQNPKTQYFNANVTDELAFPAENIGLPAEDINRRITAVAERFGIGHLLHRSIFHLSGGQKQRIAVAAATMLGPRLVVLDEPTSNLDANAIADMRAMIEQMKDEGLTIVIAEHRLAWLNGVADRYVVFDGGHIVQDYEADEFLSLSPAAWPPWDCGRWTCNRIGTGLRRWLQARPRMSALRHCSAPITSPSDTKARTASPAPSRTCGSVPAKSPGSWATTAAARPRSCAR